MAARVSRRRARPSERRRTCRPNSTRAIMVKQVTERPVALRQRRADLPEDLERIIMRLLEKNPADRIPDGETLVAALDGAPVAPVQASAPKGFTAEVGL